MQHDPSKYIDIRHHFLREKVHDNAVELSHIATTNDNLADALTKPLSHELFDGLRERIGVLPLVQINLGPQRADTDSTSSTNFGCDFSIFGLSSDGEC